MRKRKASGPAGLLRAARPSKKAAVPPTIRLNLLPAEFDKPTNERHAERQRQLKKIWKICPTRFKDLSWRTSAWFYKILSKVNRRKEGRFRAGEDPSAGHGPFPEDFDESIFAERDDKTLNELLEGKITYDRLTNDVSSIDEQDWRDIVRFTQIDGAYSPSPPASECGDMSMWDTSDSDASMGSWEDPEDDGFAFEELLHEDGWQQVCACPRGQKSCDCGARRMFKILHQSTSRNDEGRYEERDIVARFKRYKKLRHVRETKLKIRRRKEIVNAREEEVGQVREALSRATRAANQEGSNSQRWGIELKQRPQAEFRLYSSDYHRVARPSPSKRFPTLTFGNTLYFDGDYESDSCRHLGGTKKGVVRFKVEFHTRSRNAVGDLSVPKWLSARRYQFQVHQCVRYGVSERQPRFWDAGIRLLGRDHLELILPSEAVFCHGRAPKDSPKQFVFAGVNVASETGKKFGDVDK